MTKECKHKFFWMAGIFLISVLVRIIPAYRIYGSEDTTAMAFAVTLFQNGLDPYYRSFIFNQSPFWVTAISSLDQTLRFFHVALPLFFVVKILPIIADGAISALIYLVLLHFNAANKKAVMGALFYALNPVSIIITSVQGNPVSMAAALLLAALYVFIHGKDNEMAAICFSSLLLGLAIMSKIWPVLVLPLVLQKIKGAKKILIYAALSIAPLVLSLAPLFLKDRGLFFQDFLEYQGKPGWWGFTGFYLLTCKPLFDFYLAHGTKILMAFVLLLYFFKTGGLDLFKGPLLVFLAALFFMPGFGLQYLIWVLPFIIIAQERMLLAFTVYASIVLFMEFWYRPYAPGLQGALIKPQLFSLSHEQIYWDIIITNYLNFPLWFYMGFCFLRMLLVP